MGRYLLFQTISMALSEGHCSKSSRGGNISSTEDKLSQLLEPNRPKFLGTKNLLKQTIRKTLETTPKQNIVRTPRKKFLGLKNRAIRKIPKKKTVRTPREN